MKNKVLISLVVVVVSIMAIWAIGASAATVASGSCGTNAKWTLDSEGTLSITGSGAMKDYAAGDAPWYSRNSDIKKVVVGDSITRIGSYALCDLTNLTKITLGNNVTSIGDSAISFSRMKYVTIPDSVIIIEDSAFEYCSSLVSITIGNGVTSIGKEAFFNCTNLSDVTIGDSVASIGTKAFYNCNRLSRVDITDISSWCKIDFKDYYSTPLHGTASLYLDGYMVSALVIPNGVESIGSYAFYKCSQLTKVTIPDSVKSVGSYAFTGCSSLKQVDINDLSAWCKINFKDNSANPLSNGGKLYLNEALVTKLVIPDDVESIGTYAFVGCSTISSVIIGSNTSTVGTGAFYSCSNLKSISIPDTVTSIGGYAFYNCDSIESITIPDSVTSIGSNAFNNCDSLKNITIGTGITIISSNMFYGCKSLENVTIPDGVESIGSYAFYNCSGLTSVVIPKSIISVDTNAFSGCSNIKTVYFTGTDSQWKEIYFESGNGLLTNAYIAYIIASGTCGADGDNLTWTLDDKGTLSITGTGAMKVYYRNAPWYSNRDSIVNIAIGENVTSISDYAFLDCSNLESITIPNSVTSIDNGAFAGCSSLESITIPNSVTDISNSVFYGCSNLKSIIIPNNVTTIWGSAFSGCSSLKHIAIPNNVTSINNEAFYQCNSLESVTIGTGVTIIQKDVFKYCNSLKNITVDGDNKTFCSENGVLFDINKTNLICYPAGKTDSHYSIPNGVTSVGLYAFWECDNLVSVIISDSVINLGEYAFFRCKNLTSVEMPSSVTSIGWFAFSYCNNLTDVYYTGTEEQWNNISVDEYNEPLLNATIHFVEEEPEVPADYKINSITIKDMSGNSLEEIPEGNFLATVSITNVSSNKDAVVILAQYSESGVFKGLMYIQTEDVPVGSTIKLSVPVDNTKGDVATLEAYCWESFGSLKPIGNMVTFPAGL